MVSLEGSDDRLRGGGEEPGGDKDGGEGVRDITESGGDIEHIEKFENINISKLISDWDRREVTGVIGDELGGDGQRERRRRSSRTI